MDALQMALLGLSFASLCIAALYRFAPLPAHHTGQRRRQWSALAAGTLVLAIAAP